MDTKRLMLKLNQISSQNLGKIMYALFLISILESLSFFAILSPVMRLFHSSMNVFALRGTTLILAFVAICVWLTFQFGFAVMLLQMTRRRNTNLGYIFIGFKCFNPAGKIIGSFGAFIALLAVAARFIAKFIFLKLNPDFSFETPDIDALQNVAQNSEQLSSFAMDTLLFIALFLAVLFVISLFVLIRFVFVFQLHFDNPNMSVLSLFKKSASLMHGQVLRLIFFALRAGGKQLLIAVFLALIVNFIPEEKYSALSILAFLINIAYFINFYTAMIRIYLTVPVLYEERINPVQEIEEKKAGDGTETTENNL